MPVESYFEMSEHTRYVRMMAQAAPYIQNGKVVGAPTLGWKSPSLNTQVRLIAPLWGNINAFIPNRK